MTTQRASEHRRPYQLGIDVGSTTVKAVVLDGNRRLFSDYRRHNADVRASPGALPADLERARPGPTQPRPRPTMKPTGSRKALSTDIRTRTPTVRHHWQNGRGPRTSPRPRPCPRA